MLESNADDTSRSNKRPIDQPCQSEPDQKTQTSKANGTQRGIKQNKTPNAKGIIALRHEMPNNSKETEMMKADTDTHISEITENGKKENPT